jgi:signal peptidase I
MGAVSNAKWVNRLVIVGLAIALALIWFHFRLELTLVSGESMRPTLEPGQLLLVDKRAYGIASPQRGDIVMVRHRGELLLKRIVGLPGEEVEVKHGRLYIDGALLKEDYAVQEGSLDVGKGKLFHGDFATLGDNRAIPAVLAVHPIVSKAAMVGKVILVYGGAHRGS